MTLKPILDLWHSENTAVKVYRDFRVANMHWCGFKGEVRRAVLKKSTEMKDKSVFFFFLHVISLSLHIKLGNGTKLAMNGRPTVLVTLLIKIQRQLIFAASIKLSVVLLCATPTTTSPHG